MRRNPREWRMDDVKTLCGTFGLDLDGPPGGSHYRVSDPTQRRHLTIPFARPIKPAYIKQLVGYVDAVLAAREGE